MSSRPNKHNTVKSYYAIHDKLNGKSPATDKPYPAHTITCLNCDEDFQVFHYPRMKWANIKWCSLDCCWQHRYGRGYELTPQEKRKRASLQKEKHRIHSWLRHKTPDEKNHWRHLTSQVI